MGKIFKYRVGPNVNGETLIQSSSADSEGFHRAPSACPSRERMG